MSRHRMPPSRFSRPYLLRAFFEWIVDNHATPYIVVDADDPDVIVPEEYVENGRIVLNISPEAVRDLLLSNEHIMFGARFRGIHYDISVPVHAVSAIYAKENGRGMIFKEDEEDAFPPSDDPKSGKGGKTGGSKGDRSHLKVVK